MSSTKHLNRWRNDTTCNNTSQQYSSVLIPLILIKRNGTPESHCLFPHAQFSFFLTLCSFKPKQRKNLVSSLMIMKSLHWGLKWKSKALFFFPSLFNITLTYDRIPPSCYERAKCLVSCHMIPALEEELFS